MYSFVPRALQHPSFHRAILALCHLLLRGKMQRSFSSKKVTGSICSEHRWRGCFLILHVSDLVSVAFNVCTNTLLVYGLGLSSPQIVSHIWENPDPNNQPSVFETLRDNSLHTLVMVSTGTVTGGLLMIKIVKHVSPKVIQFWGFLVLFVLFIVTGSAWTKLLDTSRSGLIVLYVLSHIAFNLGPNVTTFIVSSLHRLVIY